MPHHSRVNFWLLLAATLCVDAVAVYWLLLAGSDSGAAYGLFLALASSQTTVACIWAVFTRHWSRWVLPFLVPVVIADAAALAVEGYPIELFALPWPFNVNLDAFLSFLAVFELQASLLLFLGWLAVQFQPQWLGPARPDAGRWRFSVLHLLTLMTLVAALLVLVRAAKIHPSEWIFVAALFANNLVIAGLVFFVLQSSSPLPRKLVNVLGGAALLGMALELYLPGEVDFDWLVNNTIQVPVLWLWLQVGRITRPASADVFAAPVPEPLPQGQQ